MAKEVLWVRFDPYLLTADRWWRRATPALRGVYWTIITDLYTEGGRLALDAAELAACCGWDDGRDGPFGPVLEALLAAKFDVEVDADGREWLTHKKVAEELAWSLAVRERAIENGKKGGRPPKNPEEKPWVFEEEPTKKPTGFETETGCKTTDRPTDRTDRPTDRQRNRPTERGAEPPAAADGSEGSRFFRFVQALEHALGVRSRSDTATVLNAAKYVSNLEKVGDGTRLFNDVMQMAKESRTAKKPIAVWCNRLKSEYGWQPGSNG